MPTFYNFTQDRIKYSFDDVFVPVEFFQQGKVWGWGDNGSGDLATNTADNKLTPVTTFNGGVTWKQVSAGYGPSAAIKTDGTLWIWSGADFLGYNTLGINTTGDKSTPVTTFAGGTTWRQVSCGNLHSGAIKTDGTLWLWGDNSFGALGIGTTSLSTSTPVTTISGGTNWKQVSCGVDYTLAVKTDGTLWGWGSNNSGRLGINTATVPITVPTQVFGGGVNWKLVSAGFGHAAAIKTDGTLWTWGRNAEAQLGTNDPTWQSIPVTTFAGGTDWKYVDCGGSHTAAIKTDGTLWVWGDNTGTSPRLGINTIGGNVSTPVTTFAGGTNWKYVACGTVHTLSIKTDGTLWNWGGNDYGALGIGDTSPRATPVTTFLGGVNWKQVSGGPYHTLAITYEDTL